MAGDNENDNKNNQTKPVLTEEMFEEYRRLSADIKDINNEEEAKSVLSEKMFEVYMLLKEAQMGTPLSIQNFLPKSSCLMKGLMDEAEEQIKTDTPSDYEAVKSEDNGISMSSLMQEKKQKRLINKTISPSELENLTKTNASLVEGKKIEEQQKNLFLQNYGFFSRLSFATEDEIDEKFSAVNEKFPWMEKATQRMWLSARKSVVETGHVKTRPVLIWGVPGIGKTYWANEIANILSPQDAVRVNAATENSGMGLCGVEKGWGSAAPGDLVLRMLRNRVSDPVVIIDEMDKSANAQSTSGKSFSLSNSLLNMMDAGAKNWRCPLYQENFDLTDVNWIFLANTVENIPEPMLSRLEVIQIPHPDDEHLLALIPHLTSDEDAQEVVKSVFLRIRRDRRVSPRDLSRMTNFIVERISLDERQ